MAQVKPMTLKDINPPPTKPPSHVPNEAGVPIPPMPQPGPLQAQPQPVQKQQPQPAAQKTGVTPEIEAKAKALFKEQHGAPTWENFRAW